MRTEAKKFLSAGLNLLRGVTGDDAYDRYLAHHRRMHPDQPPMTAGEFFQAQLEHKWNCIGGCC